MSLDVALQSVAFYVLSCATCSKINHRRKARATAKRERAEKHALETEQPGLYRHPSPFNTNPYWNEEILLGPGPPKRKDKSSGEDSRTTSTRALNTAGQGSSLNSEGYPGSSATTAVTDRPLSGEGWNMKRYQREDEELWGREGSDHDQPGTGQRIREAFARAEESMGSTFRLLEGRISGIMKEDKDTERNPYYVARNPPVNDLHPPVVSTAPTSKEATRWMLQPPPSAKIMEGKERATRDRSTSRSSSRKAGDIENLSRQITERAIEEKLRRGEIPTDLEMGLLNHSALSLKAPSSIALKAPKITKARSQSFEEGVSEYGSSQQRGMPSPFSIAADRRVSIDSIDSRPSLQATSKTTIKDDHLRRPGLDTINSSSIPIPTLHAGDRATGDEANLTKVLQDLSPPGLQSTLNARSRSVSPIPAQSVLLPPAVNAMPASIPPAMREVESPSDFKFPTSQRVGPEMERENLRTVG